METGVPYAMHSGTGTYPMRVLLRTRYSLDGAPLSDMSDSEATRRIPCGSSATTCRCWGGISQLLYKAEYRDREDEPKRWWSTWRKTCGKRWSSALFFGCGRQQRGGVGPKSGDVGVDAHHVNKKRVTSTAPGTERHRIPAFVGSLMCRHEMIFRPKRFKITLARVRHAYHSFAFTPPSHILGRGHHTFLGGGASASADPTTTTLYKPPLS